MKLTALIGLAIFICIPSLALAATGEEHCAPATLPKASINTALSQLFATQYGPGWIGGDSTYSARLPDGRMVFTFSDTLVGTAKEDGTASITGMPRNSLLVGPLDALVPVYPGTQEAPQSFIPAREEGKWFWAFGTYVENDALLIFVNEFDAGNFFGRFTGKSGIAMIDIPEGKLPRFNRLILLPDAADTAWGRAVLEDGNYRYIYGMATKPGSDAFSGMKIARVPRGQGTQTELWHYWNGGEWQPNAQEAAVLPTTNELDGVMKMPAKLGKGYMAVSIPFGVFTDTVLQLSFACSPQGPWSAPATIYTLPEITGPQAYKNEIAYLPTVHPELGEAGRIIVSYNINTTDGFAAYKSNIHVYQPRFLTLSY